ncbi:hypothetical protein, partial [Sansalvadorimonas verongulae]|uniref:hypothetical protein n=1 Tax=Sansalvadorimonas verongulae TaxID=2172824 RepID=UPI0018AD1204
RRLRYSRGWEKGEGAECEQTHYYRIDSYATQEQAGGVEVVWLGDDQPENFAMEGVIRLRLKGMGREVSQKLVNVLAQWGVDISRPDSDSMQEQYIDSLIACYCLDIPFETASTRERFSNPAERRKWKSEWLCRERGWHNCPRWEGNHRIYAGRCVFYRPDEAEHELEPHSLVIHSLQ